MKSLAIAPFDDVEVKTRKRVLDALLATEANVLMACGGKGLCATCHVYVEAGADNLTPPTPRELLSLKMLNDVRPNSRLACQARVLDNGVQISLPSGMYIESTLDLESLVGRRAEGRILHPVDGRVLIETGKLITRGRITQLKDVDIDVEEMRKQSLSV